MNKLTIEHLAAYNENYSVDIYGNIYSNPREGTKGGILKTWSDKKGYKRVSIWINGKMHQKQVHRIVAEVFLPNPQNKSQVNHKDGVKNNNHISNIEWATPKENTKHAFNNGLAKSPSTGMTGYKSFRGKEVFQYDINGKYLCSFGSIRQAGISTNTSPSSISYCINNKLKSAGGFIWKSN